MLELRGSIPGGDFPFRYCMMIVKKKKKKRTKKLVSVGKMALTVY